MISAIIITKNEEKNIEDCLQSVKWCDEIIVVDDYSEDKTAQIAKNSGAKVFLHNLDGNFSKQRNFGLENASCDWVLFIDADERVSEALAFEISSATVNSLAVNGYFVKRNDFIWGKILKHGESADIKLLRLARTDSGKWIGSVHERWEVKGDTRKLNNPLIHYPHQTTDEFLKEINFYSTLRANELYSQSKKSSWFSIIVYPIGKFFTNYIQKMGVLDGIHGFVFAMIMTLHSFLVRSKLWLLWQKS